MSISDQLRRAVQSSELSVYQIAREAGVRQQTLDDFVRGTDSRGSLLDALAEYFGMRLTKPRTRSRD